MSIPNRDHVLQLHLKLIFGYTLRLHKAHPNSPTATLASIIIIIMMTLIYPRPRYYCTLLTHVIQYCEGMYAVTELKSTLNDYGTLLEIKK